MPRLVRHTTDGGTHGGFFRAHAAPGEGSEINHPRDTRTEETRA